MSPIWYQESHFQNAGILKRHIPIKTEKGLISYKVPASWGQILKFPINKNHWWDPFPVLWDP